MLGEDLRKFLTENANILTELPTAASLGVVQQNKNDFATTAPATRIWFARRSSEQDLAIDGTALLSTTYIDLECISTDIDTAIDLADVVKGELHGYRGTFGNGFVGAVFVQDHSDDYDPFNLSEDAGCHVAALDIQVIHCE